ncbi:MAG: terpene cyclase/mutase family protein [Gemmatales bacterium]
MKEKVRPAIEAGVEYLKSTQTNNGVWGYMGNQANLNDPNTIGATALIGIALMECGVSPKDRQIQAAYNIIRQAVSNPSMNYNYSICLSILFLDRVNRDNGLKHKDAGTIMALATRITRGQVNNGGWGYNLPSSNVDNSNTQFAVVALWVARKYTKPGGDLDRALARTEARFRNSQRPDGGWSYDPTGVQVNFDSTGSMTCAGILGIALHAGAAQPAASQFPGSRHRWL